MNNEHAQRIIALLYASADPLPADRIQSLLNLSHHSFTRAVKEAEQLLVGLPFTIYTDTQGYRLMLKQDYASIAQLVNPQADLSRTALTILALIAYTQPIMQSEVTRLMGNVYDQLKQLEERGFISRTRKGRSFEIRLGQTFYRYFEIPQGNEKDILTRLASEHGITLTHLSQNVKRDEQEEHVTEKKDEDELRGETTQQGREESKSPQETPTKKQ